MTSTQLVASTARRMRENVEVIPDAWIGGYLQGNPGATVQDAVDWWMDQAAMERQWIADRIEAKGLADGFTIELEEIA